MSSFSDNSSTASSSSSTPLLRRYQRNERCKAAKSPTTAPPKKKKLADYVKSLVPSRASDSFSDAVNSVVDAKKGMAGPPPEHVVQVPNPPMPTPPPPPPPVDKPSRGKFAEHTARGDFSTFGSFTGAEDEAQAQADVVARLNEQWEASGFRCVAK